MSSSLHQKIGAAAVCLCLGLAPLLASSLKAIRASANPPAYRSFSIKLSKDEQFRHALNRLTFGPRPRDLRRMEQTGLKKWIDAELHPERVPENPQLLAQLAELKTLGMSAHETYVEYPPRRVILDFARRRGALPEDPELRFMVVHLASQYLQKKDGDGTGQIAVATAPSNPGDDADLELRAKLTDVLTPAQIDTLHNGRPKEKQAVLESIAPARYSDFAWALRPAERRPLFALAPVALRRELMRSLDPQAVVANDLSEAKLLRAIYSNHQLAELLADFWFNHFNVSLAKGGDRYQVPTYEREAIRPHVFGSFYDLLLATAKSPAMLFYLDNWQSVAADAPQPARAPTPGGKARTQRGLNENYGRELLELHTLGVDGGYTQADVINVARCFTGWTIANPRKGGGFEYNDRVHDKGSKVVLGHVIPAGGGMNDGLAVLQILAHQPATARFISLKLAQRFVADDPPPSLVNRMAQNFLKTGGDLRALTKTMIESPEFWSRGADQAKVKTPLEMVASAVRAADGQVTSAFLLSRELQKLGEPLYRKTEPTGYGSSSADWISSAALLERMNFAVALAQNAVPGVTVDTARWQALLAQSPATLASSLLGTEPSEQTTAALSKALASDQTQQELARNAHAGVPQLPSLAAGLVLGAPEFQRR